VTRLGQLRGRMATTFASTRVGRRRAGRRADGDRPRLFRFARSESSHLHGGRAPWLATSRARYDAIFLDAYRQPYIPFYLATREFFALIRAHVRPGGTLIINVGHIPGSDSLEKVVSATLRAVFPFVARDVVSDTNSLVIASAHELSGARVPAARTVLPAGLDALAAAVGGRLGPALQGGAVYTDDRAPVEWLTDLSILQYATGQR